MSQASTPSRSRPRRGQLSPTGVRNRIELAKHPSPMSESVLRLGIVENSQLHKDLVQAIRQFTGYTKRYPNNHGLILPRNLGQDGNPRLEFNKPFLDMVGTFLSDRKGGSIFFPPSLPHDADWDDCHVVIDGVEPRLIWSDAENKLDICVNMALIFESLKNDGIPHTLNLDKANFFKSFDTEDCYVCGSPQSNPNDNALVKCHECHCHFHQQCYSIVRTPEGHEWWFCRRCNSLKDEKDERARKLAEDSSPKPKRRKGNERTYSTPASDYTRLVSETPIPPLSPILPQDHGHLLFLARRNARPIFRSVDLEGIHSVEDLFYACGATWGMQVEKLYIYLPGSDHDILEVVAGNRTSFTNAMKMFQPAPDNDQVVLIRMLLLAEGESY